MRTVCDLPEVIDAAACRIEVSPDGRFAAVVEERGERGVVVDIGAGAITMRLDRGKYHVWHCAFSVAFFDMSDPETGALLSAREPTRWADGIPRPA